jgi:hypothetical protein
MTGRTVLGLVPAFLASSLGWAEPSSDARPILDVTAALDQTVADFTRRNDAAAHFDEMANPSAWFRAARDDPRFAGLRLRYGDSTCEFVFPPGRFLEVAQDADRVSFVTYIMPVTTLNFEEAVALAGEIRAGVKAAGWAELRWYDDVSREKVENNPGPKRVRVGRLTPCGHSSQEAGLSIKDAGQEFSGTSMPLNAQVRTEPVRPGGEYVLVLEVYKTSS